MRPRYCHCHPPPPPICDFFFISRWVGRLREFSQESWLDYLTWSLPTPYRVFALHLFSFSSQSSAVRYREPIMEKNTREITIFSFFPPPDPDFSFSELHSERKKQMNSNLVYESRPFPHLKHGLVLEKNWDWTRGYDHLTRFDRCPAPITS